MNLHGIVAPYIGTVNPLVPITIQRSTGYTKDASYKQVPTYAAPAIIIAQVQSLTADDLHAIEGLNIQGEKRAVYINGRTDGIIREDKQGGDLVTWNGIIWLNVHVLEYWPDWCKFVITRQDGS
jgi:hypothetical protein